jgi:uncharacterized protein (TIGR00369 family)
MREPDDPEMLQRISELNLRFEQLVPHNRALGLKLLGMTAARASFLLPYAAHLVGNPETGVLHGGAISAAMDAACGTAVFQALPRPMPIATLDLRIDYLKPATAGRDVKIDAHCYKVTRNVAFVRGLAYHDDDGDPIASVAGSFMLGTRSRPRVGEEQA